MIAVPPESSRARLLKLRRAHPELVGRNRRRELGLFIVENPESAARWLTLQTVAGSGGVPVNDSDVISIAIQLAWKTLGLVE
jgi:hypothetical protein